MARNTARSRSASMAREEQDRRTEHALAILSRGDKLESLNFYRSSKEDAAGSPTHLADHTNRYMEPDCDTYTLCGHLLPDREYGRIHLRDHPPPHAGETYCERCMDIFVLSKAPDDQLPDELWVQALDNYRHGRPTPIARSEMPAKPRTEEQKELDEFFEVVARGEPFERGLYRYEVSPSGERRLFGRDCLLLTETRAPTKDRTKAFIKTLRLESGLRYYGAKSDVLRLASAILRTGKLSMEGAPEDEDDIYIVFPRRVEFWPEDYAAVFSRSSETAPFRCTFAFD
jgi:hypothetical protein